MINLGTLNMGGGTQNVNIVSHMKDTKLCVHKRHKMCTRELREHWSTGYFKLKLCTKNIEFSNLEMANTLSVKSENFGVSGRSFEDFFFTQDVYA